MTILHSKLRLSVKMFKDFFANLSTNLVNGLPTLTNKFGIDRVKNIFLKFKFKT